MPLYEVRVEGIAVEFWEVRAANAEEAKQLWADGEFMGSENYGFGVESVTESIDWGEEDDYDPDEDPYVPDFDWGEEDD